MFPFSLWVLLLIVVVLTSLSVQKKNTVLSDGYTYQREIGPSIYTALTILILAFFTGNTIANDVYQYRLNFTWLSTETTWSELYGEGTGSNPLFIFIEVLFKRYISTDPSSFHLFEGFVVQTCFVLFFRRYSPSLAMSLFMFITSGLFYFTMVSWKQSMAMSIGLASIPLILRRKNILYFAILLIAMLIHPYIIMYAFLPYFINNKVWTKINILILTIMIIVGSSLSEILSPALEFSESVFGDAYDENLFSEDSKISIQRVIFFSITPMLSIVYRKQLNTHPVPLMNGFIQMSVVSFGFMIISLSGGAVLIGRMGVYFEPFTFVALPYILLNIVPKKDKSFIQYSVLTIFLIFFCFLQLKRGSLF